jgi:hypothetical protein
VNEDKIPTLATILPGYQDEYEDTKQDIKLSHILGVPEEHFEFITKVAEMFFISEKSLSMCIKKTLTLIQEKKGMITYAHSVTVLAVCMQVRERYTMMNATQKVGLEAISIYQSKTILASLQLAEELGISDYFTERLTKRLVVEHKKERKRGSVEDEAERAIRRLLGEDDGQ